MNRILKRFRREHRQKNPWVFHKETWGDLEVLVMPRSIGFKVVDSNTGIVTAAPFHGTLRGCVVVNDGSRPNCDEAALNLHVTGDRNKYWAEVDHPWCIPRRRPIHEQRNEAYQEAVAAIMEGRGYTREQAEWLADRVLGWSPDSLSCGVCRLLIPGLGARELIDQAREYKWRVILPLVHDSWRCPACAHANAMNIPSDEELAAMAPGEFK